MLIYIITHAQEMSYLAFCQAIGMCDEVNLIGTETIWVVYSGRSFLEWRYELTCRSPALLSDSAAPEGAFQGASLQASTHPSERCCCLVPRVGPRYLCGFSLCSPLPFDFSEHSVLNL